VLAARRVHPTVAALAALSRRRRRGGGADGGLCSVGSEAVALDDADVMHALARLYRPNVDLAPLKAEFAAQPTASEPDSDGSGCCTPDGWHALLQLRTPVTMCALLAVAMQLCPGGTVVVLFSGPILEGFAPERRNAVALLCNAAALPGCLLALAFADRLGRRKLLISSAVGQCFASVALGTFFLLKTRDSVSFLQGEDLTVLAAGALAAVQFAYTLGWGTVVGVLMSELIPAKARGAGTAVAQAVGGLANSSIQSLITPLAAKLGLDVIFYGMGSSGALRNLSTLAATDRRSRPRGDRAELPQHQERGSRG
jgi:hypothetical protein